MGHKALIESSEVFPVFPTLVWKTQVRREVYEPLFSAFGENLAKPLWGEEDETA